MENIRKRCKFQKDKAVGNSVLVTLHTRLVEDSGMRLSKMRYGLLWVTGDLYSSNTLFWRVFRPVWCLQWLEIHVRGRIIVWILMVITSGNNLLPGFAMSTVEHGTNHHPMSQNKTKQNTWLTSQPNSSFPIISGLCLLRAGFELIQGINGKPQAFPRVFWYECPSVTVFFWVIFTIP